MISTTTLIWELRVWALGKHMHTKLKKKKKKSSESVSLRVSVMTFPPWLLIHLSDSHLKSEHIYSAIIYLVTPRKFLFTSARRMDHHSRLTPEKLPKNDRGLLTSLLRRIKAESYDWTPAARSQYTETILLLLVMANYKVHRNSCVETDKIPSLSHQRGPWKSSGSSSASSPPAHSQASRPPRGPLCPLHRHLFQPRVTFPLGLVSWGYEHLDQVPEGKDCDSNIFRSAASSRVPGTWMPLKCLLSTRKIERWISGEPVILRN